MTDWNESTRRGRTTRPTPEVDRRRTSSTDDEASTPVTSDRADRGPDATSRDRRGERQRRAETRRGSASDEADGVETRAQRRERRREVDVDDPWTRPGEWYVVHTQSGYEKKVTANLHARIQSMNMEDKIFEVVIPMEEVVEFKGGRKQIVQRKVFPGYLLVRCKMDDESWYCIRNTPGVTGFVGQSRQGQKPTPLSRARGAHVPRRQGRRRRAGRPRQAAPRVRGRRERAGAGKARSPTSPVRSPRSTPTT